MKKSNSALAIECAERLAELAVTSMEMTVAPVWRLCDWLLQMMGRSEMARKAKIYAQGDVVLIRTEDVFPPDEAVTASPNCPVVLAEGEHSGHRHAFYGEAVMFRGDLLPGIPRQLYIGHVWIGRHGAVLEHGPGPGRRGDHAPLNVPRGTYIAVRQREYTGRGLRAALLVRD